MGLGNIGSIFALCAILLFIAIDVWIVLDEVVGIYLSTTTFLTLTYTFFGLVIFAVAAWIMGAKYEHGEKKV
jgi:hypothetical protein